MSQFRMLVESSTVSMANISSSLEYGEKYIAASPPTSGSDADRAHNTGVPQAIDSITGNPKPSSNEDITVIWAAEYKSTNRLSSGLLIHTTCFSKLRACK